MKKEIILYIRLSLEDEDLGAGKRESGSIQNQREYLYQFLENHPQLRNGTVRELIDDGYSGTNFDRPAMQELIWRVKMGKVQTVIVKDLSRLGRNYIDVGKCLEELFPQYGVRFLSVNDHYDSEQISIPGMEVVFQNIIYDYYSKELSAKVIQAKTALARKGKFLGAIPPFGYLRNPENPGQLLVDMEAAKTVKEIFKRCLDGETYSEIARTLNQRGVECPEERLRRLGIRKKKTVAASKPEWKTASVRAILRNPAAAGTVVNHRVKRKQMGRKQLISVPAEERILAEGRHEAIISPEEFQKVQELLDEKQCNHTVENENGKAKRVYPLTGLMKCTFCGANLVPEGKGKKYYVCPAARTSADNRHRPVNIEEGFVVESLLQILMTRRELEEIPEENCHKDKAEMSTADQLPERKRSGGGGLARLYDSYTEGKLSREEFLEQKRLLRDRKEGQEKKDIQNAGDAAFSPEDLVRAWKQREYGILKKIFRENIESIWVNGDGQVDIKWKNI